jgi:hypothetical protein
MRKNCLLFKKGTSLKKKEKKKKKERKKGMKDKFRTLNAANKLPEKLPSRVTR